MSPWIVRRLALPVWLWVAAAPQTPAIRVLASESTKGGVTTYSYRVVNGARLAVVGLEIGYDRGQDAPQLRTYPLGWTVERGIPASGMTSPSGWTGRVVTMEESALVSLAWSSDQGPQWDIAPGATATGFTVRVATRAPEYRRARFDVLLANATHVVGSLEPDTLSPQTVKP
jgi:hypothetical protein